MLNNELLSTMASKTNQNWGFADNLQSKLTYNIWHKPTTSDIL